MELAKFGNWSINVYKIEYQGDSEIDFSISIPSIVQTGTSRNCILYQWLIEIASDTRFSIEDIYSLNTAFFYALDNFRTELNIPAHALLAETLKAQQAALSSRQSSCYSNEARIPRDNSVWYGKLYKL
jgi:hypothetical protein